MSSCGPPWLFRSDRSLLIGTGNLVLVYSILTTDANEGAEENFLAARGSAEDNYVHFPFMVVLSILYHTKRSAWRGRETRE